MKKAREVTISSVVFAIILGAIMNASITYSGLKIGFTIVGSSIAAVLGFGVLRGVLRRGHILETNITQTIASSVNSTNSGVIFTVPVLLLLGYGLDPTSARFWLVTLACMAGSVLGTAFIIPLRKQMIDIDRLRFPSGTAVGAILKSPGAGVKKTLVLLAGIVVAMLIYLPTQTPTFYTEADTADLDALVAAERISDADAERTRVIAGWIDNEAAPGPVVEAGRMELERRALGEQISKEPDNAELRTALDDLTAQLANAEAILAFNPDLTAAAARATDGEVEWSTLKNTDYGWAHDPFWGYGDLGLRMPRTVDQKATADAREVNPKADEVLTEHVDRDENGRPDQWVTDGAIDIGRRIGIPDSALLMFAIAPFALGAGYLSGRAGLMVLAGGVLAYLVLNPILFSQGYLPGTVKGFEVATTWGRNNIGKPLGIGLLLGGALMGVVVSFPSVKAALASVARSSKSLGGSDELGLKPLIVAALAAFVLLYFSADLSSNEASNRVCPVTGAVLVSGPGEAPAVEAPEDGFPTVRYKGYELVLLNGAAVKTWNAMDTDARNASLGEINSNPGPLSGWNRHLRALLIAAIGTIWIWFAGIIIAQCTGMTDWSPISGIALLTVVLVMVLAGVGSVIPAVLVGATLCCAITMAADMMADLRTGSIVGASPKRQQIVELATTWIGPLICMMTILLIAKANMTKFDGIPMGTGTDTTAPQAEALRSVITGVQGGDMPYAMYGFGTLLGLFLGLGSFAGLGVLIGLSMYLPFIYITTYGIGCIANILIARWKGRGWAEEWGVPFAAGLIVGEAILSLIVNAIVVIMSSTGGGS